MPYFVASAKSSHGTHHPRLLTGRTTPGWKGTWPDFPWVACLNLRVSQVCSIAFAGINELVARWAGFEVEAGDQAGDVVDGDGCCGRGAGVGACARDVFGRAGVVDGLDQDGSCQRVRSAGQASGRSACHIVVNETCEAGHVGARSKPCDSNLSHADVARNTSITSAAAGCACMHEGGDSVVGQSSNDQAVSCHCFKLKPKRVGIVMADFPGAGLINRIIDQNYECMSVCIDV